MLDPRREVTDIAVQDAAPPKRPGPTTAEAATYVALQGDNAREPRRVSAAILANASRRGEH